MYQSLKSKGLILKIEVSEETSYKTLMNGFEIQLNLTEEGVTEYKQVIAGVFAYINRELISSLASFESFEDFEFYKELRSMCDNGFNYFKICDAMDNVCELSTEMIFTKNLKRIIKDTYSDTVVEPIEMSYIKDLLGSIVLEKAKIIISGKGLTQNELFLDGSNEE